MVGIAQLMVAPGCEPGGRRFESGYSPQIQLGCRLIGRTVVFEATYRGSSPRIPATFSFAAL